MGNLGGGAPAPKENDTSQDKGYNPYDPMKSATVNPNGSLNDAYTPQNGNLNAPQNPMNSSGGAAIGELLRLLIGGNK